MPIWKLEDYTNKHGGFLRITCDGERAADVFPYAKDEDPQKVIERAHYMVDLLNSVTPGGLHVEQSPDD